MQFKDDIFVVSDIYNTTRCNLGSMTIKSCISVYVCEKLVFDRIDIIKMQKYVIIT